MKGERDGAYRPIDFYFKPLASKQFVKNLVNGDPEHGESTL